MSDDRVDAAAWARINALLDDVLDLDPAVRDQAIAVACAGDAALLARVRALVDADARAGRFLDPPAAASEGALIGRRLGPYRVVHQIGRGGMGDVYLGERADGAFEQQVAIKVVRRGLDTPDAVARFVRERQILARLEHPAIARLLDGGVTPDGRPFFAMEYVEGVPITDAARAVDVDRRLTLFLSVCEAIRYAHQHLVVHRDLKASNVLVTPEGRVKLLDFGIAKLIEQDEAEAGLTRIGTGPLTPEYAAPEQIRGQAITTATDVYALGALLYELLTGRGPHQFSQRTPGDIERVICEQVPPPPSTLAATPSVRRRLRGDIDTVVLRALDKEPARRYPSVEALADDITRQREGQPILARRPTFAYRSRKFVRRHATAVSAAAAVMLSLAVGAAAAIWQARVATAEAAKSREIAAFLGGLFELSSPEQSLGQTITARELLDRAAARIDRELGGQPELQAEMLTVLGAVHHQLGLFDEAAAQLRRALDLRRRLYPGDSEEVAVTLLTLANVLNEDTDGKPAEEAAREALAIRQRLYGDDDPRTLEVWESLGAALGAQGRSPEQLEPYRRTLDARRRLGDRTALARALSNYGIALGRNADYDAAERSHREALAIRREILPAGHPDIAVSLDSLAVALSRLGRDAEGIALQRESVAIRRKVYGDAHPFLAISLNNLAARLDLLGEREAAARAHREALAIRRRALGDDHPQTIQSINGLAISAFRRGDLRAAADGFREAGDRWTRSLGPRHPDTLTARSNLGAVLSDLGELEEAETVLRQALATREQALDADHPDIAISMRHLGLLLHRAGRPKAGEPLLRDSLRRHRAGFPAGHLRIAEALVALGAMLRETGRAPEAEPLLREALEIRSQASRQPDERIAEAQRELGSCLAALGRREEAERLLLESYAITEGADGSRWHAARTAGALEAFYRAAGDANQAARFATAKAAVEQVSR